MDIAIIVVTIVLVLIIGILGVVGAIESKERPLSNEELYTLVKIQTRADDIDRILNKHLGDNINVKLSWLIENFDTRKVDCNRDNIDNYTTIINYIARAD